MGPLKNEWRTIGKRTCRPTEDFADDQMVYHRKLSALTTTFCGPLEIDEGGQLLEYIGSFGARGEPYAFCSVHIV